MGPIDYRRRNRIWRVYQGSAAPDEIECRHTSDVNAYSPTPVLLVRFARSSVIKTTLTVTLFQTEIHTFGAEIIADAINFEMSRNGQVYFVNNRISQLQEIADMIHKYIPDARVAIGHGQMKPDELEKIVLDFSNYDYDVLLS